MTIRELRTKDVERLAEKMNGNIEEARHIMNCFYRIAGLYEELCVVENDANSYYYYSRLGLLEQKENKLARMTANIDKLLAPTGYRVHMESACTSIVKHEDNNGCISEVFTLGHWYR